MKIPLHRLLVLLLLLFFWSYAETVDFTRLPRCVTPVTPFFKHTMNFFMRCMKNVHRATFSKHSISFLGVIGVTSLKKARISAVFCVTPFVTPFDFFGVTRKKELRSFNQMAACFRRPPE